MYAREGWKQAVPAGAGNGSWTPEDGLPPNFLPDSFLNLDLSSLNSQDLTMAEDGHLPDNFDFWQDCLSSIEPGGPDNSAHSENAA